MPENFIMRHADQRYVRMFTQSSGRSDAERTETDQWPNPSPLQSRDIQEYFDRRQEFESQEQAEPSSLAKYIAKCC